MKKTESTQPREHPVWCRVCQQEATWAISAMCENCAQADWRRKNAATTGEVRAREIRNEGVRKALSIFHWRGVPSSERVEIATRILLTSCEDQLRKLS